MFTSDLEYAKWQREREGKIPKIKFDSDMEVELRPPTIGALVRMEINGYSIYLDVDNSLGIHQGPYRELYDWKNCYRFDMEDTEGLLQKVRDLGGYEKRYEKEYDNLRHDFVKELMEHGYSRSSAENSDDGRDEFVQEARENR